MWFDKRFEQPAVKELTDAQKVLLDAADLVEKRGLAKYTQQDDLGRVCLHGAISIAATGETFRVTPAYQAASAAMYRYLQSTGQGKYLQGKMHCAEWNNRPERTQEEVAAALRGAAETP